MLIYFLTLVVALGLLAHGKTTKYALNYYPFMILMITPYLFTINKLKIYLKYTLLIILFGFISVHNYFNIKLVTQNIAIAEHNQHLATLLPEKNVKISAPSIFVFNQITNYTIRGPIASDHYYQIFEPQKPQSTEKYFRFAKKNGDKYIIIDRLTNPRYSLLYDPKFDTLNLNSDIYGYTLLVKQDGLFIFKAR